MLGFAHRLSPGDADRCPGAEERIRHCAAHDSAKSDATGHCADGGRGREQNARMIPRGDWGSPRPVFFPHGGGSEGGFIGVIQGWRTEFEEKDSRAEGARSASDGPLVRIL